MVWITIYYTNMEKKITDFQNYLSRYNLTGSNLGYINRLNINLLYKNHNNINFRVGEKYVLNLLRKVRITNVDLTDNFDFTGFAHQFFNLCCEKNYTISIYGGSSDEIKSFVNKINSIYNLNIVDYFDGYQPEIFYLDRVKTVNSDIKILGLGNPKQDDILLKLAQSNFLGIYTCGGFISQESRFKNNFYDNYSFLPRWAIRSIFEKNHFKRVFFSSLTSLFKIIRLGYRNSKN